MTKNPTPPSITEATAGLATAQAALDQLEERLRDGDTAVTPTSLGKARDELDHARLRLEAAQRAEDRADAGRLAADVQRWHTDLERHDHADLTAMQAAYRAAVDTIRDFRRQLADYRDERDDLLARRNRLRLRGAELDGDPVYINPDDYWRYATEEADGRHQVFGVHQTLTPTRRWHVLHDQQARDQLDAGERQRVQENIAAEAREQEARAARAEEERAAEQQRRTEWINERFGSPASID